MVDGISTLLLSLEMDGVLLWLTSRLLGLRTRHFRLLTGALIGILPTLWVLLRQNLYALPWGIVAVWPIVMLSVALAPLPRRLWLASYAILLGGTVVAAGLALA
ncbi:MAG: sigma-E processing peptidase SpoIIGA, partial [Sulfobacillus sp.]